MSWEELVAAALIGTDRRPVDVMLPEGSPAGLAEALAERGPEDRLLGSAAAWTVARRAGAVASGGCVDWRYSEGSQSTHPPGVPDDARAPATPATAAGPADDRAAGPGALAAPGDGRLAGPGALAAPRDDRPLAPSARLRALLEGENPSLLPEWLALVDERGLRPPPELVPALLDHATGDPSLHATVGAAAGPLGHWLAERAPRWAFVRGTAGDADAVWAGGEQAERRALLERLRRSDPATARALLAGTFAEETWEDRVAFVATFADGLSDADEPFLEAALDDKRKLVRTAAATLLAGLPNSRLAARMAARTARLLHIEARRLRGRQLVVDLPGEPDAAAERDGVPRSGRRSERLHALLAATPLVTWTGALPSPAAAPPAAAPPSAAAPPLAAPPPAAPSPAAPPPVAATAPASPSDLVNLPVVDDLGAIVHAGWAEAAISQRDVDWARALWPVHPDSRLLAVLPKAQAEALAAAADAPDEAAQALPAPWGQPLSRAVIDAIHARRSAGERGQDIEFAGHRLDSALAQEAEDRLRSLGGRDLHRLCDILSARAAMLRELS